MSGIRVLLQDLQQLFPEAGIPTSKLVGKSWEYHLKIAVLLEVPRTEEAGSELSILSGRLGEQLCDGRFSGPSQAIEPEDALASFACKPLADVLEDFTPRSLQTPLSVPTEVASVCGVV